MMMEPYNTGPIVGRVVKHRVFAGGRKVYLVTPVSIVNPEDEGADLATEDDASEEIPVTVVSEAAPNVGELVIGYPLAPGYASYIRTVKCGRMSVVVTGCGNPQGGAAVSVSRDGKVLASGPATVGISNLTIGSGGNGYQKGDFTDGSFAGGNGAGGKFSYRIAGGRLSAITAITDRGHDYDILPAAVVGAPGGTGARITTTTNAIFEYEYNVAGTYVIDVSKNRFKPVRTNLVATCPGSPGITIGLIPEVGYLCCARCRPLPTTLVLRNTAGTVDLEWVGNQQSWRGSQDIPATVAAGDGVASFRCEPRRPGFTRIGWSFGCYYDSVKNERGYFLSFGAYVVDCCIGGFGESGVVLAPADWPDYAFGTVQSYFKRPGTSGVVHSVECGPEGLNATFAVDPRIRIPGSYCIANTEWFAVPVPGAATVSET
jgi:hypothetical protein